ncbi:HAD family hydrolase [Thermophilibacter sp.]
MIKLFASDLDGTLYNALHETDAAILRRLRRVLAAGRHVALATGRWARSAADLGFGDLPLELVCGNGAFVYDAGGELLRDVPIEPGVLEELLGSFPGVCFNCVAPDGVFVRGSRAAYAAGFVPPRGIAGRAIARRRRRHVSVGTERFDQTDADVLAHRVCKVNGRVSDPRLHAAVEAFLADHADALVNASFDGHLFEITAAGVNKGEAVAWLAGRLGVAEDEVAVYGDGGNDLAMLGRFAHAYAPRGASEAARRAAGAVIGSCAWHAVPRHMARTVRREGPLG